MFLCRSYWYYVLCCHGHECFFDSIFPSAMNSAENRSFDVISALTLWLFLLTKFHLLMNSNFLKSFCSIPKNPSPCLSFLCFFFYHNKIILSEKGEIISNMYIFGFDFDVNICFASKYHDILIFFSLIYGTTIIFIAWK